MSPKDNEEEFWTNLFSDVSAVGNNFVLWLLDYFTDTTEHTCKITNIERVVELGWSW